jgi:hypothetical protein
MTNFKVTDIQLWKYEEVVQISDDGDFAVKHSYSANIAINDEFIIQASGDNNCSKYSIPHANEAFWGNTDKQTEMFEADILDEIITQIEADGFENTLDYLEEHGELM